MRAFSFFLSKTGLTLTVALLLGSRSIQAAVFRSASAGPNNWTTNSSWQLVSGVDADGVPDADDDVTIQTGHTITMNGNSGSCLSLTINGTANWTQNRSTNVGAGGLTINNGGSVLGGIATGNLFVSGNFTVPLAAVATMGRLDLSVTGTTNISGTLNVNNANGNKIFGNVNINSGATFNSTAAATYTISGNLVMTASTITGSSTGIFNVAGTMTVNAGTSTINAADITVTGATTVNGTLVIGSATGTKTFADLTIPIGGTWNNSSNSGITLTGSLLVNGTFTPGTSTYTLSGATKTIGGNPMSIPAIACNGTYTNNTTLTSTVSLSGSGTLTNGSGSTLNISGTATISNLAASTVTNTVNYNGAAVQTIIAGTYYDLVITKPANVTATLNGATTVNNNVSVTSGTLVLNGNSFTNNGASSITTVNSVLSVTATGGAKTFRNVVLNSGSSWNSSAAETYGINGNLTMTAATITGSATGIFNIGGTVTVNAGSSTINSATIMVTGATSLIGTLNIASTNGTKTFGDLTVTGTGNWNNSANAPITINGNIVINGTFTAGTGVYTLAGTSKTINTVSGSLTIAFLTCNGTYTSNIDLTVTSSLDGTGTLTNGTNKTLTLGGTVTLSNLNASAVPNLVQYNGGQAQSVVAGTYYDLLINKTAGISATMNGNITVNNNLTVTSGIFVMNGNNLTCSGTTTITDDIRSTSTGGVKSFQNVIMNNGSQWTDASGETFSVSGNFDMFGGVINGNATGRFNIGGNFNVTSGTNTMARVRLTVAGTTTINGTLIITNTQGTKTLNDFTITSTGIFNCAVAEAWTINGNIYNDGTIIANTAVYTLNGINKTISGSSPITFDDIRCNGSYTNFNTVTTTTSLTGNAGTWTQGATGVLNLPITNGNFSVGTFNASAIGNTVNYSLAGAQNIRNGTASTYYNLMLSGSNTKSLTATTIINGSVTIGTGVTFDVVNNAFNLTVGGNWSSTGTFNPRAGTATVTFNGTSPQAISRTGGETFNFLVFSGAGVKTLGSAITSTANLTINSGATLDAGTLNNNITLKTNLIINGNFVPQNGTVIFSGAVAQSISGTTVTTFQNITQNNNAGVSLATNENINGTLTISLGTFTTTGRIFTLLSTASGTARIAAIPAGANFTGNITMQRYINSTVTSWRIIGSPVTGRTIADWNDDFYMSGFPGSNNPGFPFCSIYTYDETKPFVKDTGWVKPTNITNSMPVGKGMLAYIGPVPITMDVTGPPAKFAQAFTLTYTNNNTAPNIGWNCIANPYPSSIDWDAAGWTKTRLNNAIYVWNPNLQQYASYVGGIGTNGGSNIIPSSQAFFVQANNSAPALSLVETVKSGTDQAFMKMLYTQSVNPIYNITFDLSGNNNSDQTVVRFDDNATTGFDGDYDAHKFPGGSGTPYLTTVMSNEDYSINSIPGLTTNISIPVRVKVPVTGTYSIVKDSISNLPQSSCVILEDLLTGTFTDLRNFNAYTFTISDTTSAPRFLLHISAPISKETFSARCFGSNNGMAIATGIGNGPWDFSWQDSSNTVIRTSNNRSVPDTLQNVMAGLYLVNVTDINSLCGTVSDTFHILQPGQISFNAVVNNVSCNGMNNGSVSTYLTGGVLPFVYQWSDNSVQSYDSNLTVGNYSLLVTDANGCMDSSGFAITQPAPVIASFVASNDTAFLSQSGTITFTNTSTGASQYQWIFNDSTMINTTPDAVHYYDSTGTYVAMLIASNGVCSDTAYYSIIVINDTDQVITSMPGQTSFTAPMNAYVSPGGLNLVFDFPDNTCVDVSLLNALGENVLVKKQVCAGKETVLLPISGTAPGIYMLRVTDGTHSWIKKLHL